MSVNLERFSAVMNDAGRNLASTTERYQFIPTTRVLNVLADHGWVPFKATQARVNNVNNDGFQKHMVRLRRVEDMNWKLLNFGEALAEICLFNAHGGTAAFRLACGLFEMVCSNGLIASTEKYGDYRIRHVGYADQKVSDAIGSITQEFPKIMQQRTIMQGVRLSDTDVTEFAKAAIALKFDSDKYRVYPQNVLYARHMGQRENTLWNVFNRIQENLIKGGIFQYRSNGTRIRSREVKDIQENAKVNQALWTLAESFLDGR